MMIKGLNIRRSAIELKVDIVVKATELGRIEDLL